MHTLFLFLEGGGGGGVRKMYPQFLRFQRKHDLLFCVPWNSSAFKDHCFCHHDS